MWASACLRKPRKRSRWRTGDPTDAILEVSGQSDSVLVTAPRPRGEAEQINRERTADNIVQVLSAEVITSLPNANIADALGRLPSVTLERDEGEGEVRADPRHRAAAEQPDDRRRQRAVARKRRPADQARHAGVGPRGVDRDQQDAAGQHGRRRHRRQREPPDQDRRRAADGHDVRRSAATRRSSAAAASARSAATLGRAVRRGQEARRADRRHLRLERARHQRHRAVADGRRA